MLKKIIILLIVLGIAAFAALNVLSKNAPELLRGAVERALGKRVTVGDIDYRWPGHFVLSRFVVYEDSPFASEIAFAVDRLELEVDMGALRRQVLHIRRVDIAGAKAALRKKGGVVYHFLSAALRPSPPSGVSGDASATPAAGLPIRIDRVRLEGCEVRFMDYDVRQDGYALVLETLTGELERVELPPGREWTTYDLTGRLVQGRSARPADGAFRGRTRLSDAETDAVLSATGVWLPYMAPYLSRLTAAQFDEGRFDLRADMSISGGVYNANLHIELSQLHLREAEPGDQVFGVGSEQLLSYVRDESGYLRLRLPVQWDLRDASAKPYEVLRSSFQRALKDLVLSRIGTIAVESVLKTPDTIPSKEASKNRLEDGVEKVRDFLKF